MNRQIFISLAAAALLFAGCGEETKKAADETAAAAKETVKAATAETKEAAKEVIAAAKEKTAEAVEGAKEAAAPIMEAATQKVEESMDAVKETVVPASEANETTKETAPSGLETNQTAAAEANQTAAPLAETPQAADSEAGKALYVKCAGCHGTDGKTKAMGKSEIIAGQNSAELEAKIAEYKAGTRNVAGMGALMKIQVAALKDEDIKAIASYISGL